MRLAELPDIIDRHERYKRSFARRLLPLPKYMRQNQKDIAQLLHQNEALKTQADKYKALVDHDWVTLNDVFKDQITLRNDIIRRLEFRINTAKEALK